jgi:hypothetical protein
MRSLHFHPTIETNGGSPEQETVFVACLANRIISDAC